MFKKPLAHQSNATPLRSSVRRQLLNSIFEQYPSLLGKDHSGDKDKFENGDYNVNGETTEGISEKDLGKIILPEGVRIANFETSVGIEGTFWLTPDGNPLWMTFGRNSKEYIPTLYLLSLPIPNPPIPLIQLHNPIPPPLLTGAPLFIPAVRNLSKSWLIPDLKEGDLVSFVTSPNNSIENVNYIGVGRIVTKGGTKQALENRINNLTNDNGEKEEGKFCDILCIIDDHLWELGSKPTLPSFQLPIPVKALAPPPAEAQSDPPNSSSSSSNPTEPPQIQNLTINEKAGPSQSISSPEALSSTEVSTLLSVSLHQALFSGSLQQSIFPLPASLLYSSHVLPNRPAYIPKDKRDEIVIAKSEWKKLTKWMKEVSKEGLLKIKESKGEVIVQSYDPQHPSLQNHAGFTTIAEEEAKAAKKAAREAKQDGEANNVNKGQAASGSGNTVTANKGKSKEMVIEELWKPSGAATSFWDAAGVDKTILHPPSDMKTYIDGYLAKHSLIHPTDHRYVLLDEELGRAVGVKKPEPGQKMSRDEVMKKLKSGISWSVVLDGVVKKGNLQPITMTVKTRQGRKTVTHIYGLETFNIDIDAFAEEMRKICAGSASVQPLQGSSPKLNLQEILVQGSQVKLVTEALLAKGIPKKWMKESEDSKKKK
ncbi:uncharacterized protein L201_003924 [Kwoniella dendrophila CBS 6074]|uniref:SUI1 domain-containing protein n=1 Tax=Kwoniella dendrophila CBS 6074 TaxID=1295534 RepID=A0AAX4JWL5_9TREE